MNLLYQWYDASQRLTVLKTQELELRKQVFQQYFPDPQEGTNKAEVPGDALLVATLPYNYSLDEDALAAGLLHVPATAREKLVKYKPSLVKSVYKTLSKKAKTAFTVECMTVTPGTPSLSIVMANGSE